MTSILQWLASGAAATAESATKAVRPHSEAQLALPDFNQALKHVNGRLFPFGIFKLLWHQRKIDTLRVLTLGLKPGYRRKGIDSMLYLHIFREGAEAGFEQAECSCILEDNWDMRRGLERMGARVYKTYRIYEKSL